jgi:hypothetical protein
VSLGIDRHVRSEAAGQIEAVAVVAQTGYAHPAGAGGFGCDEARKAPWSRPENHHIFALLHQRQLDRPGMS